MYRIKIRKLDSIIFQVSMGWWVVPRVLKGILEVTGENVLMRDYLIQPPDFD